MIVERLEWENVKCYRGEHSVVLGPGVFAVVAHDEVDRDRSNWLGKSTFLDIVAFALLGSMTNAENLDALITNGEKRMVVRAWLSDGTTIVRERTRGKPSQLRVTLPGRAELAQVSAQAALEEHVGLSSADFLSTCYVRQKQVSVFVTGTGGDRQSIVDDWLSDELDRLKSAAERASRNVANDQRALDSLIGEERALLADISAASSDEAGASREALKRRVTEAEAAIAALDVERDRLEQARTAAKQRDRLREVVRQGKAIADELKTVASDSRDNLDDDLQSAMRDESEAEAESLRIESLGDGSWCGTCPVVHAECPSAKWVRSHLPSDAEVLAAAQKLEDARGRSAAFRSEIRKSRQAAERAASLRDRLDELRLERDGLRSYADAPEPPDGADLRDRLAAARNRLSDAVSVLAARDARADRVRASQARLGALRAERETIEDRLAVERELARVLGRAGVQRRVVQRTLAEVEDGANRRLSDAGIDLSVALRFERPAPKGLAETCDACGTPFDKSERIKLCGQCGAERGPKLIRGFDVALSDRSGAAEDLAGLAISLSAALWLRNRRGSDWSTLLLDEPFGALDPANRRALASHVASFVSDSFRQAFVVAHTRDVLDALPKRVTITRGPTGSRVEVSQ